MKNKEKKEVLLIRCSKMSLIGGLIVLIALIITINIYDWQMALVMFLFMIGNNLEQRGNLVRKMIEYFYSDENN